MKGNGTSFVKKIINIQYWLCIFTLMYFVVVIFYIFLDEYSSYPQINTRDSIYTLLIFTGPFCSFCITMVVFYFTKDIDDRFKLMTWPGVIVLVWFTSKIIGIF